LTLLTFGCLCNDQVMQLSHKITTVDWRQVSVCLLIIFLICPLKL